MAEYGNQYPFWVLAEVLDFADMSRLYEGMRARDQLDIAEGFGIRVNMAALSGSQQQRVKTLYPLVRWMEQFTVVRNTCAHHSRLWNKSFTPVPTAALRTSPHFALLPPGKSERVFGTLTVMSQLLRVTSPGTAWPTKVVRLLRDEFLDNPLVSPPSLGIPDDWSGDV